MPASLHASLGGHKKKVSRQRVRWCIWMRRRSNGFNSHRLVPPGIRNRSVVARPCRCTYIPAVDPLIGSIRSGRVRHVPSSIAIYAPTKRQQGDHSYFDSFLLIFFFCFCWIAPVWINRAAQQSVAIS